MRRTRVTRRPRPNEGSCEPRDAGARVRVEHPGLVAGHENRALVWREGGAEHGGGVHELLDRVLANGSGGSGGPGALRSGCAWDHAGECEQRQGQTSVRGWATHAERRRGTQQSRGVSPPPARHPLPPPPPAIASPQAPLPPPPPPTRPPPPPRPRPAPP